MSDALGIILAMKARMAAREQARRLRQDGLSLREIAAAVDASVSSVSVWTRDLAPAAVVLERVGAQRLTAPRLPVVDLAVVRRCGRCGMTLPLCAFGRGQYRCRRCFREYFQERGDLHRAQSGAALARRRTRAKQHVLALLQMHRCADCGETDPVVLELDHVKGKNRGVAQLAHDGASIARLDEEIALCDVVCVCCHRRRTTSRRTASGPPRPGRARNAAYVRAVLARSRCVDCGEKDPLVLDFDHIGTKRAGIANLVVGESPLEALEREIGQCVVRCANCHRRRTSQAGEHFRSQHA